MPNFDTGTATKRDAVARAEGLLDRIRAVYSAAKGVQAMLALFQAGTDPTFNTAVTTLYTASERSELAAMGTQVNALIADWEANHAAAIGG